MERGGFQLSALGRTVFRLAFRPQQSFQSFRWQGRAAPAVLFATLMGGPAVALGHAAQVGIERGRIAGEITPVTFLALVLAAPGAYVYVRAQTLHLVLVLGGRASRPFVATLRGVAYSQGAVAWLLVLPFVGTVAFLVWATVLEATALCTAHGLSLREAAACVVAPSFALTLALLAGLATWLLVPRQLG